MRCEKCGAEIDKKSRFCYKCGAPVIDVARRPKGQNICPGCGKELPADSKFCIYCGKAVGAKENSEEDQPVRRNRQSNDEDQQASRGSGRSNDDPHPQKNKSGLPQIIIMIGAIIILVVLAIVLIMKIKGTGNSETDLAAASGVEAEDEGQDQGNVTLNESDFESEQDLAYITDCFSFSLPDYWQRLAEEDQGETTISFYQKKSVEAGYDGLLFEVAQVDVDEVTTIDDYDLITTEGDMCYVLIYPTEITYDTEDKYTELEYERLLKDTSYISTSLKVTEAEMADEGEPEEENNGDYIIPDSDSRYLTRDDLTSLSAEQLRLARNEIYARRGRMFQDDSLQAYFDSKSWYNGTIAPDNFTDSMLTDVERINAEFIRAYEAEIGVNQ